MAWKIVKTNSFINAFGIYENETSNLIVMTEEEYNELKYKKHIYKLEMCRCKRKLTRLNKVFKLLHIERLFEDV